jgi:arsenate reductase
MTVTEANASIYESMSTDFQSRKRLLFVCVENSNRSQMAEAFARIHGGRAVEVFSAGSRPSGQISAKAIEAMRAVGYDLSNHASKSLAELPAVEFDFVATMGCGDACPNVRALWREDWNIPDPKDLSAAEFSEIRDKIENRVIKTLRELRVTGHLRSTL